MYFCSVTSHETPLVGNAPFNAVKALGLEGWQNIRARSESLSVLSSP